MGSRTIAHRFSVMDTDAFNFVLGTDFFVQHSQIQPLTLQAPYLLYVDHDSGRESVPLEQSEHTSSYPRVSKEEPSNMMAASKTEDYQLLGEVLDQGLKELGYSREDLSVELFASDKQHVLDLYCSKGKNCSYKFYWPSFGMAYGNPRFSELGKVLTKVALERSRMVLCSPDWGAHGGNEYWRNLLDRLTISSVRLPDEAIYVPLGRKTPIGKPGWGSMLSVVDGGLTSIPWEDLDPTLVQAIQRESDGLALGDLKDRLRPQDAIETIDAFPWGAWPRDAAVTRKSKQAGKALRSQGHQLRSCHETKRFRILATLKQGNKSMYSNTSGYVHMALRLDWGKGITGQ